MYKVNLKVGFGRLSLTEPYCHFELDEKLPKPYWTMGYKFSLRHAQADMVLETPLPIIDAI